MRILGFSSLLAICTASTDIILNTKFGKIEGFRHKSVVGPEGNVFLGIPYAKAPVGERRFQKPELISPWAPKHIEAKKFASSCVPFHRDYADPPISEDCLYMNIVMPTQKNDTLYPVFFFIHGGAYEFGHAMRFGYDRIVSNFASQGVITVTFTYRLGPLGFLSFGDADAPGNLGLWDMAMALKFLHEILPSINGDPSRITVAGNSAGAAATSALTLSPVTRDLFSQAMQLSGSSMSEFMFAESVTEDSKEIAFALGCEQTSTQETLDCLREKSTEDFLDAINEIGLSRVHPNCAKFHPRFDGNFFPEPLGDLLRSAPPKKVLSGIMDQESARLAMRPDSGTNWCDNILRKDKYESFTQNDLIEYFSYSVCPEPEFGRKMGRFLDTLIDFYVDKDAPLNAPGVFYLQRYADILSDLQFNVPVMLEAKLRTKYNWENYFYVQHYDSETVKDEAGIPVKGAYHCAELKYLFDFFDFPEEKFTEADKVFQRHLVGAMVNFLKTGNPSTDLFEWPQTTNEKPYQHAALYEQPKVEPSFREDAVELWLDTIPRLIGIENLQRLPMSRELFEKYEHSEL